MTIVVGAVILWVVPIFVAHAIGKPKHRSGALYGFFLGWLGVLVIAVMPNAPEQTLQQVEKRRKYMSPKAYETALAKVNAYMECPHCKEQMRADATVCPHCQRDIIPASAPPALVS